MRITVLLLFMLSVLMMNSFGQVGQMWEKWSWLIGEWKGDGAGQPGQGGGTFSFAPDLDGQILVRKSHSVYTAANDRPATVHDDLMIVYRDPQGEPTRAIYFDNEGHTILYLIAYAEKSIVLTSEKAPDTPVFRLTYTWLDPDRVDTKFEISRDGVTFTTYIQGKSSRSK